MKKKKSYDYARFGYIFSIPFVVAWCIFQLYPILYTLVIGFTDLKGIGTKNFHVLWTTPFANFTQILTTPSFQTAFKNTVFIWLMNFVPQIVLALVITAWFTDRRSTIKAQGFFKVIFYLPNIITAATVAILFSAFFGYPMGPVTDILTSLGFIEEPVHYFMNATIARGVVVFIQTWMWYGYTMINIIAGVNGISPEIFESAEVDGANRTQTFFQITLPNIKTVMLFILVTSLIGGLTMFDIPKLLVNNSGPDNATKTASVFIYEQAFTNKYMYNVAGAGALIIFVFIVILSSIMFYVMRDKDEAELKKLIKKQEQMRAAELKAQQLLEGKGV